MVIYIDILIVINTALNYAVLMTAERLLKRDIRLYRLILGAFIGALFSLMIFADIKNGLLLLPIRLISSAAVALTAFGYKSRAEFIKAVIMTAAVSAVYCGGLILFYQLFKPVNMLIINDVPYFELDPLLLILTTAVIYFILLLIERLFRERIKTTVVRLSFTVNGTEYSCPGKIDTGCNLTEPFSASPVIVADRAVFSAEGLAGSRVIPYTAVGGSSFLFAVRADSVSIDGEPINKSVYIASADIKNGAFGAVINSDIIR